MNDNLNVERKNGSLWKIILGVILVVVICLFGVIWTKNTVITDSEKYGQWNAVDLHSGLRIFPEQIHTAEQTDYYYKYSKGMLDDAYQIYLKCTLRQEDFEKEIKRLEKVADQYEGKSQEVTYQTTGFRYPAYVSIYNFNSTYEYALIDADNLTVYYIYLQFVDEKDIVFNRGLIPENYMTANDSFSIYAYHLKGTNGWYIHDRNAAK